jgi:hypothetical protein
MKSLNVIHIEVDQEADESIRFHYTNTSTGLPVDLTGFRAELQVRCGYEGNTQGTIPVLIYTSETNGGIVLGGVYGTIDLYISYEDTKDIVWNTGKYTLYLITPASARIPFAKGFFTVNPSSLMLLDTGLPNIVTGTPAHPNNEGKGGLDSSNG